MGTLLALVVLWSAVLLFESAAQVSPDESEGECRGANDGFYTKGCDSIVWRCRSGRYYAYLCPTGLYFDKRDNKCKPKSEVEVCKKPVDLSCRRGEDQYPYKAKDVLCTKSFYRCVQKKEEVFQCPKGMFFSDIQRGCNDAQYIPGCLNAPEVLPREVRYRIGGVIGDTSTDDSAFSFNETIIFLKEIMSFFIDDFCKGKTEGVYPNGCQSFAHVCKDGKTYKLSCNKDFFYDPITITCKRKEQISACGNFTSNSSTSATSKLLTPDEIDFINECSAFTSENFFFGARCQTFYFVCYNHTIFKMVCPSGLFYDSALQTCKYRDEIEGCGGRRANTAENVSSFVDFSSYPTENITCEGMTDGSYAFASCTRYFWFCQDSLLRKEVCANNLYYNKHKDVCDLPANVQNCNANDRSPNRQRQTTAAHYSSHGESMENHPNLSTLCKERANGQYSIGCASQYIACINETPIQMSCPDGLQFSEATQMCDYSDNAPECGGAVPLMNKAAPKEGENKTALVSVPIVTIFPYNHLVSQARNNTKEVHARCTGRLNGVFILAPCSPNYLFCINELATIGACRGALFYNGRTGLCEHKSTIESCVILSGPKPLNTSTSVAPSVRLAAQRLNRPTTFLGTDINCSNVATDQYAISSCSPYYARCQDGSLKSRGSCPMDHVFSPSSRKCVTRASLPACSAENISGTTSTEVPSEIPLQ